MEAVFAMESLAVDTLQVKEKLKECSQSINVERN